jgi:hypothetical protein
MGLTSRAEYITDRVTSRYPPARLRGLLVTVHLSEVR